MEQRTQWASLADRNCAGVGGRGVCWDQCEGVYIYTYIRIYKYTNIHIYIYTFLHIYIYTYIHIYIYTYIHIYTYTYIHIYISTYIHIYINTYIHIYIYTYIHIHTYIYIFTYLFGHEDSLLAEDLEQLGEVRAHGRVHLRGQFPIVPGECYNVIRGVVMYNVII
jgi:hypothetical protein